MQICKLENAKVDALSQLATLDYSILKRMVFMRVLAKQNINEESTQVLQIEYETGLIYPIIGYLKDEKLSDNKKVAKMLEY